MPRLVTIVKPRPGKSMLSRPRQVGRHQVILQADGMPANLQADPYRLSSASFLSACPVSRLNYAPCTYLLQLIPGGLCASKFYCMQHTDFELGEQTEVHIHKCRLTALVYN